MKIPFRSRQREINEAWVRGYWAAVRDVIDQLSSASVMVQSLSERVDDLAAALNEYEQDDARPRYED